MVFSTPFHFKQAEVLKKNWLFKTTELWPPYGFQNIRTADEFPVTGRNTVGMVSSGMELRKHLGHMVTNNNRDYLAETGLIECLKAYASKNPSVQVIVYLHPQEKMNPENLRFSQDYYRRQFGQQVSFAPIDKPSKEFPYLCDVGIAGFSSAQIERLFGGYKTLFAPLGYLENYFMDERLDRISIKGQMDFDVAVTKALSMDEATFFTEYGLTSYRRDAYKIPAEELV
jgi:hypothetical protein